MAIVDKIRDYINGGDYYDEDYYDEEEGYYDEEEVVEDYREERKSKPVRNKTNSRTISKSIDESNVVNLPTNQKSYVVISAHKNIDDSVIVIDSVKDNKLCIVNLEGIDQENAQRIADFLSGAIYAVNGEIQRVSNDIFVCAPANVDISGILAETLKTSGTGILPWLN